MEKEKSWFRRHWFLTIIGGIVLLAIIAGTTSEEGTSSNLDNQGNEIPKENGVPLYKVGDEIKVGDFKYTIHGIKSKSQVGETIFGTEKADGVFLIVDLTVENIENEPEYFQDNIFITDSKGREFEEDIDAKIYYGYDNLFDPLEKLQPGLPKRAEIIFDVPKDTEGKVGIKNSMWSSDFSAYISW